MTSPALDRPCRTVEQVLADLVKEREQWKGCPTCYKRITKQIKGLRATLRSTGEGNQ